QPPQSVHTGGLALGPGAWKPTAPLLLSKRLRSDVLRRHPEQTRYCRQLAPRRVRLMTRDRLCAAAGVAGYPRTRNTRWREYGEWAEAGHLEYRHDSFA